MALDNPSIIYLPNDDGYLYVRQTGVWRPAGKITGEFSGSNFFSAGLSGDTSTQDPDQWNRIPFNLPAEGEEGGLDTETGVWTCPLSGIWAVNTNIRIRGLAASGGTASLAKRIQQRISTSLHDNWYIDDRSLCAYDYVSRGMYVGYFDAGETYSFEIWNGQSYYISSNPLHTFMYGWLVAE